MEAWRCLVVILGQPLVRIPATLRLFCHDCFIEGCDASIMIASPNGDAEKDYSDNLSLAGDGFDTVVKAKQAVEAQCPGVVSCADILALAARDVVVLEAGGPTCFANRLYSFSSSFPVDPSLDPDYAKKLMSACRLDVDPRISVYMDPQTPQTFDNAYYQNLVAGRGLFTSDEVLTNSASKPTVIDFANTPGNFNGAFITAMRNLGRVGVKTGNEGETRKDCAAFNHGDS
ncbi:hypothetical protein M0R45_033849 [Rubus argutus]|uniref:peroxidase n=1 Tax=Rubus argutus TaxID=59490 RepID=A0AAW1WMC0_RUBAR